LSFSDAWNKLYPTIAVYRKAISKDIQCFRKRDNKRVRRSKEALVEDNKKRRANGKVDVDEVEIDLEM
jgi:hypothetical protein